MWLLRLQPKVKLNDLVDVPLDVRYNQVMQFATQNEDYYHRLVGNDDITQTPAEYIYMSVVKEYGLGQSWNDMSLKDRAKYVADFKIRNMTDVIRRHKELQEEEKKKADK